MPTSRSPHSSAAVSENPVIGNVWPPDVVVGWLEAALAEPLELPEPAAGVDVVAAAKTTIVPCMNGWILQMKANVPGWVKV
jgi:hypothetical protein